MEEKDIQSTRLYRWMKELGFHDYEQFYRESITRIDWFWGEVEKKLDFRWYTPYEKVLDDSNGIAFPSWYVKGTCNVFVTALEKWAKDERTKDKMALFYENELGKEESYSFSQLYEKVIRFGNGLREQGVKKGDRIFMYMNLTPDTVIAFFSIVYVGAIVVPAFSGFGKEAILSRIEGCNPRIIITSKETTRRGKEVDMLAIIDEVRKACPSIEKVIVSGKSVHSPFLSFQTIYATNHQVNYEIMKSDDPFLIIYTSGTTGKPKGTVHTHSGFPIKAACDGAFGMDIREGDRVAWMTDMGWMMGPFLLFSTLLNGATMVLYDGAMDYPNEKRFFQFITKHNLTHMGLSPTFIRGLMGMIEAKDIPLLPSSLRLFASTGEPWNPISWNWLFEKVGKKKIPIFNYSGGTEISGGILGNILTKPITPATFNAPLLGMAAEVRNDQGDRIENEIGELCLTKPWVGMTKSFWQNDQRYVDTYWNRFENVWVHGDWVKYENGYWEITGRSDDTLNIAGKRIGPVEYESMIVAHKDVIECATIGIPHELKGEVACCFVVGKKGMDTKGLQGELLALLEKGFGKALVPKDILFLSDLPKTRNGKIMRRMIRNAYLGKDLGDTSSLVNKDILLEIEKAKKMNEKGE